MRMMGVMGLMGEMGLMGTDKTKFVSAVMQQFLVV